MLPAFLTFLRAGDFWWCRLCGASGKTHRQECLCH